MSNNTLNGDAIDAALVKFAETSARKRELGANRVFRSAGEAAFDFCLRTGRSGGRMVSLASRNPCGKVLVDGRPHGEQSVDRLLAVIASGAVLTIERPGANKPEHDVQAHLIRKALEDPARAPQLLDSAALFDELVFVTDEFRIDDKVRADMLMLGRRKGATAWVPVFIELKAVRKVAEPMRQLSNIVSLSTGRGARFDAMLDGREPAAATSIRQMTFTGFLRAATGVTAPIDPDQVASIVVMPADGDKPIRRRLVDAMARHSVELVEYRKVGDDYVLRRGVR